MIELRDIKVADLIEVEKLYKDSVAKNKEGFIQQLHLRQNIKDFITDTQNSGGAFLGLFINNQPIGMLGAAKTNNANEAEICKFHLSTEYQGKRLGQMMYSFMELLLINKGIKVLDLHVTKTQKQAIALYQKNNFKPTFEKLYKVELEGKTYNFDTIHMKKTL